MNLHLRIWRQENSRTPGQFMNYDLNGVSEDSSFLEMLDLLNQQLITEGKEPVAFDHDCREGICGTCSLMINGVAHGQDREKVKAVTACQLHM
ncbi:MAG: 2Fe-2S iron-sulfur cluster binding domain-containing protein, partial [Anaerolineae bacterium]|nr:2Fe-2S iron-sulfur cluster binding domain-containing protein [Anaerolineae bacterium]